MEPKSDTPDAVALRIDPASCWLFCDFDGTLVGFAPTPDAITVPAGLDATLNRLHARAAGCFAIVSGRTVPEIATFLPAYRGDIWGAHGAASRRDGQLFDHALANGPEVAALKQKMQQIGDDLGALVEMKSTGAVLHYRSAPALEQPLRDRIAALLDGTDIFELHDSKMAWEVRPKGTTKGDVVAQMMADHPDRTPVVFGDDTTDEEAMEIAFQHGGFGVRVGDGATCARYRLSGPAAMLDLIDILAKGTDL